LSNSKAWVFDALARNSKPTDNAGTMTRDFIERAPLTVNRLTKFDKPLGYQPAQTGLANPLAALSRCSLTIIRALVRLKLHGLLSSLRCKSIN
jgi:hypothetical protein